MMEFFTKKHKGFTLIELLVVIAIIGILASIVLVSLGGARARARDAQRQSDMRQVVTAEEMYYGINEQYSTSTVAPGTTTLGAIGTYLEALDDPITTKEYVWLGNEGAFTATGCTVGEFFCVYAIAEEASACAAGEQRIFYASEEGTGEFCSTTVPAYALATDCECY